MTTAEQILFAQLCRHGCSGTPVCRDCLADRAVAEIERLQAELAAANETIDLLRDWDADHPTELATATATINRVRSVLMTLHSRADSPEYSHIEDDLVFAINRLRTALEPK